MTRNSSGRDGTFHTTSLIISRTRNEIATKPTSERRRSSTVSGGELPPYTPIRSVIADSVAIGTDGRMVRPVAVIIPLSLAATTEPARSASAAMSRPMPACEPGGST